MSILGKVMIYLADIKWDGVKFQQQLEWWAVIAYFSNFLGLDCDW